MPMHKESALNYIISAEQVLGCCDTFRKPEAPGDYSVLSNSESVVTVPEILSRNRRLQSQSSVCSSIDLDCGFCAIQEQMQQQQFVQQMLERHNELRARHQVAPLTLNQNVSNPWISSFPSPSIVCLLFCLFKRDFATYKKML
jgi:hypothetical protein